MSNQVTPEERSVAARYGMTDAEYLAKKAKHAANQGISIAALTELNKDDLNAIRLIGQSSDSYHKQKLAVLAETVILKN